MKEEFLALFVKMKCGDGKVTMKYHEIDGYLEDEDIVSFIKSGRTSWIGHWTKMGDERITKCTWKEKLFDR